MAPHPRRTSLLSILLCAAVIWPTALVALPSAAGAGSALSADCGSSIAKPTGGYWTCTFSDDFNGTTLDSSKWAPQVTATSGYHSGKECFVNSPNNISVNGGFLYLSARREAAQFNCANPLKSYPTRYTSGMVSTFGTFSQAYGRFEVRAALTAAKVAGLQTSFWLWPVNSVKYGPRWPASGEIDIAEMYSQYWSAAIPYIHYDPATLIDLRATRDCFIGDPSAFHTYATEWTPHSITILYDGATCLVEKWNAAAPLKKPQPFDQPFFLNLTQALGIGTNTFNPALTPLPAVTQIDYVHVWQ